MNMISPEFVIDKRYKGISISVNELNQVFVRLPSRIYLPYAKKYYVDNYQFVEKCLSKNSLKKSRLQNYKFNFVDGDKIILFDEPVYELKVLKAERNRFMLDAENDVLTVYCKDEKSLKLVLGKFYRKLTFDYASERSEFYADKLGVSFNQIRIKDTKTRWGSCSSKGNLNFNFRLVLAPERVFDYLVIHEVCHLLEMNHSKRYWVLVESLMPDYKKQDNWLKENGFILKYFLR